jgi:hypothetical protein
MEKTEVSTMSDFKGEDTSSINLGTAIVEECQAIYIDPEKEKAVLRKFDKYFLPQAFLFILLNYLDRSNLGKKHSSFLEMFFF